MRAAHDAEDDDGLLLADDVRSQFTARVDGSAAVGDEVTLAVDASASTSSTRRRAQTLRAREGELAATA